MSFWWCRCPYLLQLCYKHCQLISKADHFIIICYRCNDIVATYCVFQGSNVAVMASDSQSVLGQAFLKYADALALDDTKAMYHFHVGRLLVTKGDYSGAVARLETALSCNEQHQLARLVIACYCVSPSQHSYLLGCYVKTCVNRSYHLSVNSHSILSLYISLS